MRFPNSASEAFKQQFRNKLDNYRTYSYHFLWAIGSDTGELLRAFTDETLTKQYLTRGKTKDPVTGDRSSEGGWALFINSNSDMDFAIDSLSTKATVVPPADKANPLPDLSGTIVIREFQGVRLLNVLRQVFTDVRVSPETAIHCIKPIFVGHHEDGTVEYVLDVPPIFAVINNMVMTVDKRGGSTYSFNFTHIASVPLKRAIANSGSGVTLNFRGTIKQQLDYLMDQYTKAAAKSAATITDPKVKAVPMTYSCVIDSSIAYVANWQVDQGRAVRNRGESGTNPRSYNGAEPIESIIHEIFKNSEQYVTQYNAKNADTFSIKVVPIIDTTKTTAAVTYNIVPARDGAEYILSQQAANNNQPVEERFSASDRVVIYDYIFSGRNTDIEEIDIKVADGYALYVAATQTGNMPQTPQGDTTTTVGVGGTGAGPTMVPETTRTMMVGPSQSTPTVDAKQDSMHVKRQEYQRNLERATSLEAVKMGCILNIRGNPGWLGGFNVQPTMSGSIGAVYAGMPLLYVNILTPTSETVNRDASVNDFSPAYEPFWYQGLWKVLTIESTFSAGTFSNSLTLLAIGVGDVQTRTITEPTSQSTATSPSKESTPSSTPVDKTIPSSESIDCNVKLTEHFTYCDAIRSQYAAPSPYKENRIPTEALLSNMKYTLECLETIWTAAKRDFGPTAVVTLNSAFRGPYVNSRVGGASNSDHMTGQAVDFNIPIIGGPKEVVNWITGKANLPFKWKKIIVEVPPGSRGWVHMSVSQDPNQNWGQVLQWEGGRSYPTYKSK